MLIYLYLFSVVSSNIPNNQSIEQKHTVQECKQLLEIVQYMIYRFVHAYYLKEVLEVSYIPNCIIHDETSIYEEKLSKMEHLKGEQLQKAIISLKQDLRNKIDWIAGAVQAEWDDKFDQYAPGLTDRVKLYFNYLKHTHVFKHFKEEKEWSDWRSEQSFGEPLFEPPKQCVWMFVAYPYRYEDDDINLAAKSYAYKYVPSCTYNYDQKLSKIKNYLLSLK